MYLLSMVMVSQVHAYVKAHQRLYLKYVQFGASQVALVVKNPPANTGDIRDSGSIPGSGRFPGGGPGNPLQYSCLENPHGQRSLTGCSPWGSQRLEHDGVTKHNTKSLVYSLNTL